ncbi:IQ domain-containing protein C [Thalassophryne amazonica]|uniref:IQ domain-containing protein C n=1 Tax=Thalassophryne amazonica TaxID=390379 RepID=UPI0014709241|nr:IQ domain-containing protein C [Thalassophryne amazonica]
MERSQWEKALTYFQACARGYLVRKEVCHAQEDFEDIVREIDGGLSHLEWQKTIIPIPHFTDIDSVFLRPSCSASQMSDSGPSVVAPLSLERRDCLLPEETEADRDDSYTGKQAPLSVTSSSTVGGGGREKKKSSGGDKDAGVTDVTGDSTTIWTSSELNSSCGHSHKDLRQHRLVQEVPHTPEALRLHRNTLTMEMVWLQQAINSRKKYLTVKGGLSVS